MSAEPDHHAAALVAIRAQHLAHRKLTAASGTADGLRLALNVAAMLIVFIAFVAMFDGILGLIVFVLLPALLLALFL